MDNPEENLMATMTDKELEDHIINPKKYGPLEIAYAVAEMRRRGTFNERNFPRVLEATRKKILPSYYSPDAILVFSFFCPILFSAILFATNLKNQSSPRYDYRSKRRLCRQFNHGRRFNGCGEYDRARKNPSSQCQ